MTRFYIDLEFIERGHKHPIELISIGIVSEDGREFYAVSTEFNPRHASQWVKDNVIACLPKRYVGHPMDGGGSPRLFEEAKAWKSRSQIRDGIARFVGYERHATQSNRHGLLGLWDRLVGRQEVKYTAKSSDDFPEFFGEWCAYDHITFCQIFGTMMDLPQGFPMRTRDIIQTAEDELGIPSDRLPPSLETDGNHNALLGARTVKMRYDWLQEQKANRFKSA